MRRQLTAVNNAEIQHSHALLFEFKSTCFQPRADVVAQSDGGGRRGGGDGGMFPKPTSSLSSAPGNSVLG